MRLFAHKNGWIPSLLLAHMLLVLASLALAANEASARAPGQFLVLGVIASAQPGEGVVLLKSVAGGKAFAARVGQEVDAGVLVVRVTREFVYLRREQRVEKVKVGEQVDFDAPAVAPGQAGEIERHGNTVRVSSAFRDEIVKRQLSKVLMQAAAVPHYENGTLIGFRLWDIDPDSIYDRAGLANGDIVTSINGQPLSDVGQTIRTLQSLRDETRVEVTFVRKSVQQTIEVVVQ